jgi:3-deoxy-7-phosphoheptulonate synthase
MGRKFPGRPATPFAAGADGLMLEVHSDPEHALTDGAQSMSPKQFKEMMAAIKRIAAAVDREV